MPMIAFEDIPNLHTHTELCKHASGIPADFCRAAQKISDTIGFSDHCPFPDDRYHAERMLFSELPLYCKLVDEAKAQFPQMNVLKSAEVEWCSDLGEAFYTDVLLGEYKMDYLIGSAHYSGFDIGHQEHFYYYSPDSRTLRDFAAVTLKLIECGLFDIIAHPDAFMVPYSEVTPEHEAIFRDIVCAAVEYKVPLELNSTGIRTRRTYPCRRFWEIAAEYPSLMTVINADAHKPEHLYDENVKKAVSMADDLKLNICNRQVAKKIIERISK
ncbi:MAG: hypothetical protein E7045_01050 [Lentisphaerae bacterium]|nr:hypothetical protein [Lentisphaerota bacterium]